MTRKCGERDRIVLDVPSELQLIHCIEIEKGVHDEVVPPEVETFLRRGE